MSDVEEERLLRFLREDGATRKNLPAWRRSSSRIARVISNDTRRHSASCLRARHSDQRTANRLILPALC
jgi:hypothetical protein